ncbi:hypothetical protein BDR07DRAFT_1491638 [Suillus spraguei]|nr:hypothetical protein BDR07DRAFT_1491638 [Suillus spraguei]
MFVTPMRVPKSLLPFNSPGPSRVSSQGLDDSYSWGFDASIFSQPSSSSLPRPQTPTLPAFPSMSSVPPLAPPLPDTPITSWRKEFKIWNPMSNLTLTTSPTAPLTVPMFNFDSCSFTTPGITRKVPVPLPMQHLPQQHLPNSTYPPALSPVEPTPAALTHPQPSQPSTNPSPSVDIPLWKTGWVHQESTRMAQANMIGGSAKRLRTGEVENSTQKKKCKSSA